MNAKDFEVIAADLDRMAHVPDEVLWEIVRKDAECLLVYSEESDATPPRVGTGGMPPSDIGCPVWRACLELELRGPGPYTGGLCSSLSDEDFVALQQVWFARRARIGGERGSLS